MLPTRRGIFPTPSSFPTMPDSIETPAKRRRLLLTAIAVLIGAVILLIVVERASVVEPDAPAETSD